MLDGGILSWDQKSNQYADPLLPIKGTRTWEDAILIQLRINPTYPPGWLGGKDDMLNWEVRVTKYPATWVSTVLLEADFSHLFRFSTQETNKVCATFKSSPPLSLPVHSICQSNVCRDTGNLCAEFSNAQWYEQLGYHLKRKLTHGQLVLVLCLRCVIASWNHPHEFSHCFSTSQPFG